MANSPVTPRCIVRLTATPPWPEPTAQNTIIGCHWGDHHPLFHLRKLTQKTILDITKQWWRFKKKAKLDFHSVPQTFLQKQTFQDMSVEFSETVISAQLRKSRARHFFTKRPQWGRRAKRLLGPGFGDIKVRRISFLLFCGRKSHVCFDQWVRRHLVMTNSLPWNISVYYHLVICYIAVENHHLIAR